MSAQALPRLMLTTDKLPKDLAEEGGIHETDNNLEVTRPAPKSDRPRSFSRKQRTSSRRYFTLPFSPMTTSVKGIAFPEAASACLAATTIPPQQGTSIRRTVILFTLESLNSSVSFS